MECAGDDRGLEARPALIAGNSVILKPAEDASLVCLRMAELALEAGLPPGVLQVVTGDHKAGAALASHDDVDCITFTGSGEVGSKIMIAAANSNMKRVSLELGGKSANIVFADAPDLGVAADVSVGFMFGNQGQVCEAPTRLLVQRQIRDDFTEAVVKRTRALKIGNPLDPQVDLGPIINASQRSSPAWSEANRRRPLRARRPHDGSTEIGVLSRAKYCGRCGPQMLARAGRDIRAGLVRAYL